MKQSIRNSIVASLLLLTACGIQDAQMGGDTSNERDTVGSMPGDVEYALKALPAAEVVALHKGGIPMFVRGNLGSATPDKLSEEMTKLAPVFRLKDANLLQTRSEVDALGNTHVRFQQMKDGLQVVGGELVVHVDANGTVYAANSEARDGVPVSSTPDMDANYAYGAAKALPGYETFTFSTPALKFVFSAQDNALHLAYEIVATGERDGIPARDLVYIDAHSGAVADLRPTVHTALNRKVYTAANGTSLPGTLKMTETNNTSTDTAMQAAFDNTGTTYNFYKSVLGRDSYNGNGATLISTVHYSKNYDNAYWDGTQMVYGDGDGTQMTSLSKSLDVTAHELTHAVTEYSANLAYQNEPGALNEAMSDIMGASTESWSRNNAVDSKTWMLGEDIWTPGVSGDALRYMDDPAKDGESKDYYPTRYTGTQDYGGVHINSGIANLAFKLLVTGGTHPRNKTTVQVTGIGIAKAREIFYRALTQYMTSNTNFAGARAATKQAATDLYGATVALSVEQAWAAVGVGSAPTGGSTGGGTGGGSGGGGGSSSSVTALTNGTPVSGIGGAANEEKVFTLSVPAGASNLKFAISGGTGDSDLYVKFGSKPTTSSYDYRPYLDGNNETVNVSTATAGTWYVMVRGYTTFSGVTLVGSFSTSTSGGGTSSNVLTNGVAVTNLSGASGSERTYTFNVPAGTTSLTFAMSGGSGDADLYVRYGAPPTTTTFDYRPYLTGNNETVNAQPQAGTWYVMVRGYSSYSGLSLKATAN